MDPNLAQLLATSRNYIDLDYGFMAYEGTMILIRKNIEEITNFITTNLIRAHNSIIWITSPLSSNLFTNKYITKEIINVIGQYTSY